ncbi:RING-H2 finger protein ATL46 [Typha latifolia]|uniref:RING-H2 finger protein ATL46 n=1 Tax=Typha latifolia TaxID=4733 RepID=UPI003C303D5E
MVVLVYPSTRNSWVFSQIKRRDGIFPHSPLSSSPLPPFESHHLNSFQRDSLPYSSTQPPPTPPSPSNRISPAVLFIIVILAVIFFISGLLHLLVRFLIKKHPPTSSSHSTGHQATEISGSEALQRQLQQLFHLHDSGLDQAFIDALPVFLYKEIVGPKEPFDCAVCLCEFTQEDKLRLLPICGHAFHIDCIDTWLLSNSTCPLCRGALYVQGLGIENPIFEVEDAREEECFSGDRGDGFPLPGLKPVESEEIVAEKRVFPVRLGKFRNLSCQDGGVKDDNHDATGVVRREEGETSSSNLDARRCYSLGSYQYVLGDSNLQVALRGGSTRNGDVGCVRMRGISENSPNNEVWEGKKICAGSKGDSFSVSKIWQWPNKKGKFPIISSDASSLDGNLPWMGKGISDT